MKRILALVILALVTLGGAGVAWAHTGDRAARREAVRGCAQEAREANPDAEKPELRTAVKACLEDQGITRPELTPEQRERLQARRALLRDCVEQAKADNPGAGRATLRPIVRECVRAG